MNAPEKLHFERRIKAIRALELPKVPAPMKAPAPRFAANAQGQSASLDNGSIVAFTANVSQDHTSMALNSTLLAQLAANYQFDRTQPSQVMNWYNQYNNVLTMCGWDAQSWSFQNYAASGSTVSVSNVIVDIVSAAFPEDASVVSAALNALSQLSSDNPWYDNFYSSSSKSSQGGSFQIVPCSDTNGERNSLVINTSAYSFQCTQTTEEFLFTSYSSDSMTIQYATQTMTLDEDIWDQVATEVLNKVAAYSATNIGNLPL
jgi:hypothetical protein